MQTSDRSEQIKPSATLSISSRATELNKQGKDVVDFGAGEPDFNTPDPIKNYAKKAIDENFTHYTAASGIPELKKSICNKFENDLNIQYDQSQISVGCGAKHVLFNIMASTVNPGDEVLLFAPYWVSYPNQIRFFGGKPVVVDTQDNEFQPTPQDVRAKISDDTELLILNSPSNPTGAVIEPDIIREIAEICVQNDILLVSDEIYEKLRFNDKPHFSPATISEKHYQNTIVVNGVSKAYAMTGWRIGYAAGPESIINQMNKLMSHSTSNPTSISQKAALAALRSDETEIQNMCKAFRNRRNLIHEKLNQLPGISCVKPEGAFYVFPDFSQTIENSETIQDDQELAMSLLDDIHLAVVPGSAFGAPGHLRFSYALAEERIREGINRIEDWV